MIPVCSVVPPLPTGALVTEGPQPLDRQAADDQAWRVIRRRLIGALSVFFLAGWLGILFFQPWHGDGAAVAGILMRVGIVLFATWLALPELERIPKWMFAGLLGGTLIVVVRPPAVFIVVPALVLMWSLRGIGKLFE